MTQNLKEAAVLLLPCFLVLACLSACNVNDFNSSNGEALSSSYSLTDETVATLIAGASFSLALTESGRIYSWGTNHSGCLGTGEDTPHKVLTPTHVPIEDRVIQIAAGDDTVGAVTEDGTLYLWGDNRNGELLDGTTTNRSHPVRVNLPGRITQVALGWNHVLALTEEGKVFQWGFTKWATADVESYTILLPVEPELVSIEGKVKSIAAGAYHSLALTDKGKLYAWGMNSRGQLGCGGYCPHETPQLVLIDEEVTQMDAGILFSLALTSSGKLYSWGGAAIGVGDVYTDRNTPAVLNLGQKIKHAAAGWAHALAVTESGTVYAWGWNEYGQLGIGTTERQSTPQRVPLEAKIEFVSAGDAHSFAITADGTVYGWGGNRCGQLYDGAQTDRHLPVKSLLSPQN